MKHTYIKNIILQNEHDYMLFSVYEFYNELTIDKIKTWLVNFDKFKIDWLLSSDYSHVYLVLSACRILSDKLYCSH